MTTATKSATIYYPEMNQAAPVATLIHATISHSGTMRLRTHPSLGPTVIAGRGIKFTGTETADTLRTGSPFVGWHTYNVTPAAYVALAATYPTASAALL